MRAPTIVLDGERAVIDDVVAGGGFVASHGESQAFDSPTPCVICTVGILGERGTLLCSAYGSLVFCYQ